MRIYTILLALLGLAVMETTTQNSVQAAVPHSCCTSYSRASAVNTLVGRKAVVRCVQQDITGPCNTKALILVTQKGGRVCVNPRARKIHPLLKKICTGRQSRRGGKRPKQRKHRV